MQGKTSLPGSGVSNNIKSVLILSLNLYFFWTNICMEELRETRIMIREREPEQRISVLGDWPSITLFGQDEISIALAKQLYFVVNDCYVLPSQYKTVINTIFMCQFIYMMS